MGRKPRNKKPPAPVVEVDEVTEQVGPQTMKEVIQEVHGTMDQPQEGLPTREWLQAQFQTKSAIVRYLTNRGFTVKEIAKHTGWRYQMVRNIATNPLKRGPNEDWRKPLMEGQTLPNINDPKPVKS